MWGAVTSLIGGGGNSAGGGGTHSTSYRFPSVAAALNRLRDATDDSLRREAAEDLKERSKDSSNHEAIGQGLHILIKSIEDERKDIAVNRASLECLTHAVEKMEEHASLINAEALAEQSAWIQSLVAILAQSDVWVRWWALKLLGTLSSIDTILPAIRAAVLATSEGPRLVADTLKDPREAVRSQAVSLLSILAHHCFPLAQLAAYGGAFEDLFDVIADCGGGGGQDALLAGCLECMAHLLDGNSSNKSHFIISGFVVSKLPQLVAVDSSDYLIMVDGKADALVAVCKLIATLVQPFTPATMDAQAAVTGCAPLFNGMARLALSRIPNHRVRLAALNALSFSIRGSLQGCKAFSLLKVPLDGGQDNVVGTLERTVNIILADMVHVGECESAMRLMQSWLSNNSHAQLEFASSLARSGTFAARLGEAVSSANPTHVWATCHIIATSLGDNASAQMTVLQLYPSLMDTLLRKEDSAGGQAEEQQHPAQHNPRAIAMARVARLRAAYEWMGSAEVCSALLQVPTRVPQLVEAVLSPSSDPHVAAHSAMLLCRIYTLDANTRQVIVHRVGADKFLGAFRGAMRTRDWDLGGSEDDMGDSSSSSSSTLLIYPLQWRNTMRNEMEAATAMLQPATQQSSANKTQQTNTESLRLRAALSAAEREIAELKDKLAKQSLSAVVSAPVAPIMDSSLEALVSRDKSIVELKAKVRELEGKLEKVTTENDRLLVIVADQEMLIASTKNV